MARTGRRPAFSASVSLPPKNLSYPALLFDGQLKTRQAPGTSFEPSHPRSGRPQGKPAKPDALSLRTLKSFPSPKAVNTSTGPQLPKYVSAAFGSLDLPWKPGHLRSAYDAICCHRFKIRTGTVQDGCRSFMTPPRHKAQLNVGGDTTFDPVGLGML